METESINNYTGDYMVVPKTSTVIKIKAKDVLPWLDFPMQSLYALPDSKPNSDTSSVGVVGPKLKTPLEMIEYCLSRSKAYLQDSDPMQASEKLYKVAEESIKYLAEVNNLKEYHTAQKDDKWSVGLLQTAAPSLSRKLDKPEIAEGFTFAYNLHVEGFHENRLGASEVRYYLPYIEKLARYVREVYNARRKANP